MRTANSLKFASVIAAWLAMIIPSPFLQASGPSAKSVEAESSDLAVAMIRDVAINSDGKLVGLVINTAGAPVADSTVVVRQAGKKVVSVTTDKSGRFVASGLMGGVYEITSGAGSDVYRLWASNTAPPAASDGVLIIDSGDIVRGQMTVSEFVTSEVVIAGAIALASVAIPVAIHNSKRDPAPSS